MSGWNTGETAEAKVRKEREEKLDAAGQALGQLLVDYGPTVLLNAMTTMAATIIDTHEKPHWLLSVIVGTMVDRSEILGGLQCAVTLSDPDADHDHKALAADMWRITLDFV